MASSTSRSPNGYVAAVTPSARPLPDAPWYLTKSEAEQAAVLDGLARVGAGEDGSPAADSLSAVSALIELCHLARHPQARVPVIRALGRCADQFIAIPALHAELDSPHEEVRVAALQAIGSIGLAAGGAVVVRWLSRQDREALDDTVIDAAVMALAQTGHPQAGKAVADAWCRGQLSTERAHLALAEAVSPELLDRANEHLSDPEAAQAAALHLVALRTERLDEVLAPLLKGSDVGGALFAELLLQLPRPHADDHVLAVLTASLPPRRLGRLARSLRAHAAASVVAGFKALAADVDPSGAEAEGIVRAALVAGIPELQDVAVQLAATGPVRGLSRALYRVHSPTPAMRSFLETWTTHTDPNVAKAAIRARLGLFGLAEVAKMGGLANASRPELRLEWVRLQQNGLRDHVDAAGRSTLARAERAPLVTTLARLCREDPDTAVREIALYTVGNIGLTDLADELGRQLGTSTSWRIRRAAATALAEFPAPSQLSVLQAALSTETVEEVFFRIVRALLRAMGEGAQVAHGAEIGAVAVTRLGDASPRCRVLLVALIGKCGDRRHLAVLNDAAQSPFLALAGAAVTALGDLGDDRGIDAVLTASLASSPTMRLVAAEALGRIGGAIALERLVDLALNAEEDVDLRRVAIQGLEGTALPADLGARLSPRDLEDPLAVNILQLRLRASEALALAAVRAAAKAAAAESAVNRSAAKTGEGKPRLGADDIDRRLAAEIPDFNPSRLEQRHRDALQALRTAEFFYVPGFALPPGLDAAPPTIFWVKGLELWLDDVMRPMMRDLLRPSVQREVAGLADQWSDLQPTLAPSWRDDLIDEECGNLYSRLCEDSSREFARVGMSSRVFGLRMIALALLLAGAPGVAAELGGWAVGLPRTEAVALANGLVVLAAHRNRFTHRESGVAADLKKVRAVALACAAAIVKMRVGK